MANHLFDALMQAAPEAPAITWAGKQYSYGDLAARASQAAHALQQLGVRPGDRVLVQAEKSLDVVVVYLGVLRAGAVFVPLNTAYTASEVEYFLTDSEPAVFICDPQKLEQLSGFASQNGVKLLTMSAQGTGSWFDFCGQTCSAIFAAPRSPSDLAAILYTSGTTGRSKGAMLSHDNLLSNASALMHEWRFTKDDVLLHTLPVYHAHGLFVALNVSLLAGASMIFLPRFSPSAILDNIACATVLMGVPTHYVRLLKEAAFDKSAAGHMRLFTSGSAPLLAETHRAFTARTGHAILERYGLTETAMNTSNPYDGERRPGTVGFPLPDITVEVRDENTGRKLPAGETGSIEVNGPNVFAGYWRQPEKTRQTFRDDGFFITGDLGVYDSDGYLTIVGRSKDLVITGGLNVYPKEVESVIDEHPAVLESAVIGVPHPDFGEGVTAVVVAHGKASEEDLALFVKPRLAGFKRPKRFLFVDELPRNTMGKVQKNVLRQQFERIYTD